MRGETLIWTTRAALLIAVVLMAATVALPTLTYRPAPILLMLIASALGLVLSVIGVLSGSIHLRSGCGQRSQLLHLALCAILGIAFAAASLRFWAGIPAP